MTLGRLMELYNAELAGKQIMRYEVKRGMFESYESLREVKITECELDDLLERESAGVSTTHITFSIKGEEDKYGYKLDDIDKLING